MPGLLDIIAARSPQEAGGLLSDLVSTPKNRLSGLLDMLSAKTPQEAQTLARSQMSGDPMFGAQGYRPMLETASMSPNVLGDLSSGALAVDDLRKGNYGDAALNSLGLLPFVPALGGTVGKYKDGLFGVVGDTFNFRNQMRELGGKWNDARRAWMFEDLDTARRADKMWGGPGLSIQELDAANPRVYLNVPYAEKELAKKYGAAWDAEKRKWYVRDSIPEQLVKFDPANAKPIEQTVDYAKQRATTQLPKMKINDLSEDELIRKAKEYKRIALEGGDGYNPFQSRLDDLRFEKNQSNPQWWESVANDLKRKAQDALFYDADGMLNEASKKLRHDEFMAQAEEAMRKAKLLSGGM